MRPADWEALGEFLSRDLVLIAEDRRLSLLGEWSEIAGAEESLDDRLTVGLVGGTGVGKSTLINALAGEEISVAGDRRPTTDRVIAYRHERTPLPEALPSDDIARPESVHRRPALERLILLDFPDFDSVEEVHREILERFLPSLDIILVLADDMKYADERLYQVLRELSQSAENLHAVLNKIDRLEARYGERAAAVVEEILADLATKLDVHAGIRIGRERLFAISAWSAFVAREGAAGDGDRAAAGDAGRLPGHGALGSGQFADIVSLLEGYRQEKRRRAAKELNIEARRAALVERCRSAGLDPDARRRAERSREDLEARRREIEGILAGISETVLGPGERRRLVHAFLGRAGLGFPLDLILTAAGELRRRPVGGPAVELTPSRLAAHYRAYLEGARNCVVQLSTDAGEALRDVPPIGGDPLSRVLAPLGDVFRGKVETSVARSSWLGAHGIALAVLLVTIWSGVYPAFRAACGCITGEDGYTWGGAASDLLRGLVGLLRPTVIVGLILGVLLAYVLSTVLAWSRHVRAVEGAVGEVEAEARRRVRDHVSTALSAASAGVERWHAERAELERIVG